MTDRDQTHRELLELRRITRAFLAQLTSMFPPADAATIQRAMAESLEVGAVTKPPTRDVIAN